MVRVAAKHPASSGKPGHLAGLPVVHAHGDALPAQPVIRPRHAPLHLVMLPDEGRRATVQRCICCLLFDMPRTCLEVNVSQISWVTPPAVAPGGV